MKKIMLFLILLFPFILIGCNKGKNHEAEKMEEILGTVITSRVYGENGEEALEKAFLRANEIDQIMSIKKEDSEITKVNNNAYIEAVKISKELYYVVEKALFYADLTDGALDPTIGKIIDLWGIGTENERIPSEDELSPLINKKNYKNVELNKENSTIKFLDKDIKLALGAIAKGYVADEMKKILCEDYKIDSGILNLGGNVMAIGSKPDESEWKVGITDPLDTEKVAGLINLKDETTVTSGNYERYFMKNGIRYHHIINPITGYPAENGVISTTIITKSSIDADALSTATYVLGKEYGMELIKKLGEVEAIFIDNEGNITNTPGRDLIENEK